MRYVGVTFIGIIEGSGTSLPGIFAPRSESSHWELSLPGGAMLNYAGNAGDAGDGFMQDAAAWRC